MGNNIDAIVEALIKKSEAGEVVWNMTSSKEGFKLQLKNATLSIVRKNNTGRVVYVLWITNANGDLIVNQSIDSLINPNKFRNLYDVAKKAFYQEDATLKSVLEQVNSDGKIGEDDSLPF